MKKSNFKKVVLVSILAVLIILVAGIIYLKIPIQFESPEGKYDVGVLEMELHDSSRSEEFTVDNRDFRKLLVKVHFPGERKQGAERLKYSPNPKILEEDIASLYPVPEFLIKRLTRARSPFFASRDVRKLAVPFPVLIFSHGWNGNRHQNSSLLGNLSSQGYIIISIEHSYAASGTIFGDGSKGGTVPFSKMKDTVFTNKAIEIWSADQRFVLDEIMKMADSGLFPQGLNFDFNKVAVFGHSFGGATAAFTLSQDSRFKAGINMDGFYFGKSQREGFYQPFMELRADNKSASTITEEELADWQMDRNYYQYLLFDEWKRRIGSYALGDFLSYTIRGTNHMSYSDFPLLMPLGFVLAPENNDHQELTTNLVQQFFDLHLKRQPFRDEMPDYLKRLIK